MAQSNATPSKCGQYNVGELLLCLGPKVPFRSCFYAPSWNPESIRLGADSSLLEADELHQTASMVARPMSKVTVGHWRSVATCMIPDEKNRRATPQEGKK